MWQVIKDTKSDFFFVILVDLICQFSENNVFIYTGVFLIGTVYKDLFSSLREGKAGMYFLCVPKTS